MELKQKEKKEEVSPKEEGGKDRYVSRVNFRQCFGWEGGTHPIKPRKKGVALSEETLGQSCLKSETGEFQNDKRTDDQGGRKVSC